MSLVLVMFSLMKTQSVQLIMKIMKCVNDRKCTKRINRSERVTEKNL